MLACFRIGAVPASCPEQLRAKDLRLRLQAVLAGAGDRRRAQPRPSSRAPRRTARCGGSPTRRCGPAPRRRRLPSSPPTDPCLITFTSGTSGTPKPVLHVQRYLSGQRLQATHWMGARAGRRRLVHGGERLEQERAQRLRRALAVRRRPRSSRTRASTPTSGWRSSRASGSARSAWRRPSTG